MLSPHLEVRTSVVALLILAIYQMKYKMKTNSFILRLYRHDGQVGPRNPADCCPVFVYKIDRFTVERAKHSFFSKLAKKGLRWHCENVYTFHVSECWQLSNVKLGEEFQ